MTRKDQRIRKHSVSAILAAVLAFCIVSGSAFMLGSAQNTGPFAPQTTLRADTLNLWVVPQGAVVPFDLDACPKGWSEFASAHGRLVMGASNTGPDPVRKRGETVGELRHTLTETQMPKHDHGGNTGTGDFRGGSLDGQDKWCQVPIADSGGYGVICHTQETHTHTIASAGSSEPFDIVPPSVVLLYCRKD